MPCQDRCASTLSRSRDGSEILISVISDGAGSATHSERGAQEVCSALIERVAAEVGACENLEEISEERVVSWFLDVRETLRAIAAQSQVDVREYAATALLAVVSERQALCAQIGDGAIVLRRSPDAPFEIAVWPESGEYVNQTFFITDETAAEHLTIRRYDGAYDLIAFSDGLQNLALERATRSAFGPFFEPLVNTVRANGRAPREFRDELIAYLNSEAINCRTDDDKALIIGCRMAGAP
jgi:hypothetical protein